MSKQQSQFLSDLNQELTQYISQGDLQWYLQGALAVTGKMIDSVDSANVQLKARLIRNYSRMRLVRL